MTVQPITPPKTLTVQEEREKYLREIRQVCGRRDEPVRKDIRAGVHRRATANERGM